MEEVVNGALGEEQHGLGVGGKVLTPEGRQELVERAVHWKS